MSTSLLYANLNMVGREVEVKLVDGIVVQGIYCMAQPKGGAWADGIVLRYVKVKHLPEGLPEDSKRSFGAREAVRIEWSKVVHVLGRDAVGVSGAKSKDSVSTDAEIAAASARGGNRQLKAVHADWLAAGSGAALTDDKHDRAWDQFATNEQKFGVKNTYDENLYTTRLEKHTLTPDQIAKAERLASEIERKGPVQARAALGDGGDDGEDEEARYSAVIGSGAYVAPHRRPSPTPSPTSSPPPPPSASGDAAAQQAKANGGPDAKSAAAPPIKGYAAVAAGKAAGAKPEAAVVPPVAPAATGEKNAPAAKESPEKAKAGGAGGQKPMVKVAPNRLPESTHTWADKARGGKAWGAQKVSSRVAVSTDDQSRQKTVEGTFVFCGVAASSWSEIYPTPPPPPPTPDLTLLRPAHTLPTAEFKRFSESLGSAKPKKSTKASAPAAAAAATAAAAPGSEPKSSPGATGKSTSTSPPPGSQAAPSPAVGGPSTSVPASGGAGVLAAAEQPPKSSEAPAAIGSPPAVASAPGNAKPASDSTASTASTPSSTAGGEKKKLNANAREFKFNPSAKEFTAGASGGGGGGVAAAAGTPGSMPPGGGAYPGSQAMPMGMGMGMPQPVYGQHMPPGAPMHMQMPGQQVYMMRGPMMGPVPPYARGPPYQGYPMPPPRGAPMGPMMYPSPPYPMPMQPMMPTQGPMPPGAIPGQSPPPPPPAPGQPPQQSSPPAEGQPTR